LAKGQYCDIECNDIECNDIECNDDAICLKTGRDADGPRVSRPSANIAITDNTVRGGLIENIRISGVSSDAAGCGERHAGGPDD
jgi:polygalacturonase